MLRAYGKTRDGRPMILAGLAPDDLRQLKAGKPISFDSRDHGVDCHIVIFTEESFDAVAAAMIDQKLKPQGNT